MSAVPDHEHITVDEDAYWGLMYLHDVVRRKIEAGDITDASIRHYSEAAELGLEQARAWNDQEPLHLERLRRDAHEPSTLHDLGDVAAEFGVDLDEEWKP